ncbi:hypothetical protein PIB30_113147 [Stylosanthes scabra]|uniref:Uncharacterized protein n=1 Tax=Stylosanthes scabra TaxID=79078 RepID=A0ABU6ZZF7_9FABA|nr:hypothetical protein [Stylosanthes scabra]
MVAAAPWLPPHPRPTHDHRHHPDPNLTAGYHHFPSASTIVAAVCPSRCRVCLRVPAVAHSCPGPDLQPLRCIEP